MRVAIGMMTSAMPSHKNARRIFSVAPASVVRGRRAVIPPAFGQDAKDLNYHNGFTRQPVMEQRVTTALNRPPQYEPAVSR